MTYCNKSSLINRIIYFCSSTTVIFVVCIVTMRVSSPWLLWLLLLHWCFSREASKRVCLRGLFGGRTVPSDKLPWLRVWKVIQASSLWQRGQQPEQLWLTQKGFHRRGLWQRSEWTWDDAISSTHECLPRRGTFTHQEQKYFDTPDLIC